MVLSVVDFAKNYTQNEIQTMHWYSHQVTIFVHITYVCVVEAVQKYYHFYISDDKTHDTLFVHHCFMLHYEWLQKLGIAFEEHWVRSNGVASQFKATRPFYFVSGLVHGKGEHDGAGAVICGTHPTHPNSWPFIFLARTPWKIALETLSKT